MKINRLLVFLALGLLLFVCWQFVGKPYPELPKLAFTTITGKKIALADFRGKPVLVTFWATDCRTCIEEIPQLLGLYREFHPRGLEIIAISMFYDPPSHVVAMTEAKQLPYPVVMDLTAQYAQVFGNIELTPTTLLIAPDGSIHDKVLGLIDIAKMTEKLNSFEQG